MERPKRKPKDEQLEERLKQVQKEKVLFDKKAEIRAVKKQMRRWEPPTTSKLLMILIFANCIAVEIYSMWVMVAMMDISALYSLITSVITETITYAIYCAKSYHGKKEEEQIKLQREQLALDKSSPEESGMDESADPEAGEEPDVGDTNVGNIDEEIGG